MRRIMVAVGLSVTFVACSGGESDLTLDDVTTRTETPTSTTRIIQTTSPTTTTDPPSTTTTTAPEERIELAADGEHNTDPFDLSGGRYTVAYSFTGDCFYGSFLASADGSGFGDSIASGSGPVDGNTNVYGVEAGTYYLKMITGPSPGCPWRIVLVRQ